MKILPMLLILAVLGAPAGFAAGSPLTLMSQADPGQVSDTASGGLQRQDFSPLPATASVSADGRYAVFLSAASNLVPGQRDVNASPESDGQNVFLADLAAGTVTLVSHAMGLPTTSGNRSSRAAVISADGRWVAFTSIASDLVPGQPEGEAPLFAEDLLLYDRVTGTTTLAVVPQRVPDMIDNLVISADGRYIAFDSNAALIPGTNEGFSNVFLYDRVAGMIRFVSHAPGAPTQGTPDGFFSFAPRISADGRFVLFLTDDLGLLPGQISALSAVLYDRATDTLKLIGPADIADLSADGSYVAFISGQTLQLFARDTGTTTLVSATARRMNGSGQIRLFALSADGRFLVFALEFSGPEAGNAGLAIYDRLSQSITPLSRPAGSPPFNGSLDTPVLSADGHYVVFGSTDPAWVDGQIDTNTTAVAGSDIFLFDRVAGKVSLVSHAALSTTTTGGGSSFAPTISANGARVLYFSQATDLEQGLRDLNQRPDLFTYDPASASNEATTRRATALPAASAPVNSRATGLSADGRFVLYESTAAGLFDVFGQADVFLYDSLAKTRLLVNHIRGSAVTPARGLSTGCVLSADGRYVAFSSNARNLVPGANPNGIRSLFLFDRLTGTITFVAQTEESQDDETFKGRPRLSADGRWLAFISSVSNVVPGQQGFIDNVFLYDRVTARTVLVSHSASGLNVAADRSSLQPILSADGRYLAFLSYASDLLSGQIPVSNGGSPAAFLYDRMTGTTTLVSHLRDSPLAAAQVFGNVAMSSDGRYIALNTLGGLDPSSPSSDSSSLYIYDRSAGTYQWISSGETEYQQDIEISADGRLVAFPGGYGVLPQAQPGLFFYDRLTRTLSLAVANEYSGALGNGTLALSGDGRYVAFASDIPGLVPGLTRTAIWGGTDVYLLDRTTGTMILINPFLGSPVTTAGFAGTPLLSADGQTVVFTSGVDLVPGDYNNQLDAYAFTLGGSTPGGPVLVPPCVLFNGVLHANVRKPLTAAGACGVPATAKQVAIKLTVSQGTGQGNVQLFAGSATTPAAGILRFSRGATRAAPFNVSLGNGAFSLLPFVAGNGTVRASVEVDSYVP